MSDDYTPSPREWVAQQVRLYEETDGAEGGELRGMPCVVVTYRGRKTGVTRKMALMRVRDGANYVLVGSMGGAPRHPQWYHNLLDEPDVIVQDYADLHQMRVQLVEDAEERARLWTLAVAAYPDYAEYQERTERQIPLFLAEPR
jgi:deazaflavin-dependent oxidoreductase (nitroreductase family)